ncbi:MAG: arginase family protein, partial [Alphaproteobacteria bacterium]|nr:arginase family protein [Alphaproteobacteria bacterium]
MSDKKCILLGAPIGTGAGQKGCQLGPNTLRIAGIGEAIRGLGYELRDAGNVEPADVGEIHHSFRAKNLAKAVAWTEALQKASYEVAKEGGFPIFLGGDHSVAFGTIPAVAQAAKDQGRPLFVLWIDAHTDYHALDTSESGNVHGMPVAYITGDPSFDEYFPKLS